MLLTNLTIGLQSGLSLCALGHPSWSGTVAAIAIPATMWGLIVLNGRVEGYLQSGRLRRHTDGPLSILRLASLFLDGEIIVTGGFVMMYYFPVFRWI